MRQNASKRLKARQMCVDDDDDNECNLEKTSLINCTGHPILHRKPNTNLGLRSRTSNAIICVGLKHDFQPLVLWATTRANTKHYVPNASPQFTDHASISITTRNRLMHTKASLACPRLQDSGESESRKAARKLHGD